MGEMKDDILPGSGVLLFASKRIKNLMTWVKIIDVRVIKIVVPSLPIFSINKITHAPVWI
jgi:hypothetical protein